VRRGALLAAVLLLPSCAEGRVPLAYELQTGRRLEHRLVLTAHITRTLAGRIQQQRVVAAFRIGQEIVGPATAQPTPSPAPTVPASPQPAAALSPSPIAPPLPGQSPTPQAPALGSPSPASPGSPPIGLPGLPGAGAASTPPAPPAAAVDARITLVPESLEVDGRPVDVGAVQEFTVQLADDGRVVGLGAAAPAEPEAALEPVGLERLLPRLRPVLPGRAVEPGDGWRSETRFQDDRGRFSVTATSRLAQLGVMDGYEAALVRTTYRSPVHRREPFANAVADVDGEDVGAQEAWFALDGFLVRSSTDSVGTYDVTFHPAAGEPGVAPVRASLVVRLHTDMQLLSAG
jgi:hypothetical protein